jgi:hypothetical protein
MRRTYTHEQKLQYLRDGYEFVRSGKGFYKTYIAGIGVSRTTYYQWIQKHAIEAGIPARLSIQLAKSSFFAGFRISFFTRSKIAMEPSSIFSAIDFQNSGAISNG